LNQAGKQVNKVALVTGAARRIGAAIVKQLHQADFRVAIHCHHSLAEAQVLAQTLNQQRPGSALILQKDLGTPVVAKELIAAVVDWAGRLDLLVNNASLFKRSDCSVFNETDWDSLFTTNVKAPFLLSLAAHPYLALQQGAIINLTDVHADKPLKNYAVYCQSKAALAMQTKALAREFAPKVRVNAVAPGAIVWPEHENVLSIELQQQIIAQTPLKRRGEPIYIAQAVLALAENLFITGQILHVDGGRGI
jgi:pteridine reductase